MNEKPILHCVSISGGKDSSALVLKMVEKGMPVDLLLFCDTGLEFPALYRHLDKLEKTVGIPITRIKADEDFEYLFKDHPLKRGRSEKFIRNYGNHPNGYGWPGPKARWCTERLKNQPRERYLRELRKQYHVIQYVGIAADETYRLERKNNQREDVFFPLVEWDMTEADCLQYCYDRGFNWEGLYNYFSRVSCWCCPLQSLKDLKQLYHHFPEQWEQLKTWDTMTWRKYRADYSVRELEARFDFEDAWERDGKKPGTRAYYREMKKYIKERTT